MRTSYVLTCAYNTVCRAVDANSDEQKYTLRILAYFATNVRKKREAESSAFLAPPILLGSVWFGEPAYIANPPSTMKA
jgi:hypothetical protein